jgi:serine/threonine protein kinase
VLDFCNLVTNNKIGAGGTATVFRGQYHEVNVAVKVHNLANLDRKMVRQTLREVNILSQIRHTNIIWLLGLCISPPQIHVVMELAENGSLYDLTEAGVTFTDTLKHYFVRDCVRGLHRLHTNPIPVMHCDLKSLNLLLSAEWLLKLADFGESSFATDLAGHTPGVTANWSPPEVLRNEPYTWMSDVYSLAMCVYEIHSGMIPFHEISSRFTIARMVEAGKRPPLPAVAESVPPVPQEGSGSDTGSGNSKDDESGGGGRRSKRSEGVESMAADMRELVLRSWDADPCRRPTMAEWVECAENQMDDGDRRSFGDSGEGSGSGGGSGDGDGLSEHRKYHTTKLREAAERNSLGAFHLRTAPSAGSRQQLENAVAARRPRAGTTRPGWKGWKVVGGVLGPKDKRRLDKRRSYSAGEEGREGIAMTPPRPRKGDRARPSPSM